MAKEVSGFFDSVSGDRRYQADEMARRFRQVFTDGVRNGGENLKVKANGTALEVELGYGTALADGYDYWLMDDQTGPLKLAIPPPDSQPRVDRAVIRVDKGLGARRAYADIVKGTPGVHAAPPAIERSNNVYEISLGRINVSAGATVIRQSDIIDERYDPALCGIMNVLQVDYASLEADMRQEFDRWVSDLQDVLDETAAGNLLNLINGVGGDLEALGGVAVTSNTARVMHLSTADADGSLMAEGDIWIKHE